jgi:hypothetical protein
MQKRKLYSMKKTINDIMDAKIVSFIRKGITDAGGSPRAVNLITEDELIAFGTMIAEREKSHTPNETNVYDCGFNKWGLELLKDMKICTLEDLEKCSLDDLMKSKRFGVKSFTNIEIILKKYGRKRFQPE